ncbi:MAG: hypothetical protein ACJAV1_000938 [Paraglaciecola sp.]|jgi:hypothetical protein
MLEQQGYMSTFEAENGAIAIELTLRIKPDNMFFAAVIVEINHMSLGILEADEFESEVECYQMELGDRLVAFSDGVVELKNKDKMMLGDTVLSELYNNALDHGVLMVIQ